MHFREHSSSSPYGLFTDGFDCTICPRAVCCGEVMVCTELILYFSHNLVLKVTALVGDPLCSNAKGGEPFSMDGYCTVSIRVLALLEPHVVAEVFLDYEDILSIVYWLAHVEVVEVDDLIRFGSVQCVYPWSRGGFSWSSGNAVKA
jgi:hypothetical protein